MTLGYRAGLVERNERHLAGALERFAALDQRPELRAPPRRNHHRGWNGQPHRARTRDDQHRHRGRERARKRILPRDEEPDDERQRRDRQHHRDEHGADAVGQRLNWRARCLRIAHHANDASQHAVGTERGRAIAERTRAVDGAARHAIAGALGDRHRFAGDHRLVHGAFAGDDVAIDRNTLTRPDEYNVALPHLLDRHVEVAAASLDSRTLGLEPRERAQSRRGGPLGARLERAPREDERDDDDDRFVIDVGCHAMSREQARRDRRDRGVEERRACANGDERVHVGRAPAKPRPSTHVELAARPHHHERRDRQECPRQRTRRMRPAHERHGRRHRDDTNEPADQRLAAQHLILLCLRAIARFLVRERVLVDGGEPRLIPGALNGVDERRRGGHRWIERDRRAFRHEIDGGVEHARLFRQRALHAGLARRARHAANGEGDGGHGRKVLYPLPLFQGTFYSSKRYPAFHTVTMWRGFVGSSSSLRRSSATCESTVRDSTNAP